MRQLKRLLRYVRPYAPQLLSSVLLLALVGLLDAFRVLLIGPIFDRVLNPASQSRNIALFTFPGSHRTVYLQQLVPERFQNAWTIVAFALVAATVLKGIFDYLGTYLVNYAGFGERVQFAMSAVLSEFLQQVFTLIFTAGVVVLLGGKLAWVLLLFLPIILIAAKKIGRRVRHTTRRGQDKLADIQNILHETITGNRIVKAFGMELWESLRFHGAARRLFRANLRSVRAAALSSPLMDILGAAAIAMLLLAGRDYINARVFTAGSFLAFIVAVFKLYDPVRKFAVFNNNFQQALGASASIFGFMDSEDDVKEKPRAAVLPPFRGSIRFDHVSFSYGDGADNNGNQANAAREVLRDISLEVRAGEVLAIVGSSGGGKTTLVHLLPRFFDVTGGALLIDGNDVRDVTLASLRAQIGVVTQETILFNDTVRNNIAYGQPHVSHEAVVAAARAALAHEFVLAMAHGYNTIIGERGARLSGGERQRIAIARALLKNAPILILDEATSALDAESESLVQSALQNLMAGRTVFVIAHRLSTVRRADRIIVLENGTISDAGTHDELMKGLSTYRRLNDLQFVDLESPREVAPSLSD